MYRLFYLLPLFFFLFTAGPLQSVVAQDESSTSARARSDQTQVREYARPGRATIIVNVWGTVGQPGLWRVEQDIDLIEMLSVVSVPGLGLDEPGTRQKNFVAIYRTVDGKRQEIYRENLENILEEGASYPQIQDNDVLAVTQKRRRSLSFGLISSIVGTLSSVALLTLRLLE